MKKANFILGIVILVLGVCTLYAVTTNVFGVTQNGTEIQARSSQSIPNDWHVAKQTTPRLSAMLFYNLERTEHTFSIYINKQGLSFGYFFRSGGIESLIEEGVKVFQFEGIPEFVYLSMNKMGSSRIQVTLRDEVEIIEIDANRPFVLIADDEAVVQFLDANGAVLNPLIS